MDGKALTPETSLTASFDKDYFEDKDLSTLSMDFSPYGEGDTVELATTEQVDIPAKYGETYTILFTGMRRAALPPSCRNERSSRKGASLRHARVSSGCGGTAPPPAAPPNIP